MRFRVHDIWPLDGDSADTFLASEKCPRCAYKAQHISCNRDPFEDNIRLIHYIRGEIFMLLQ